MINPEDIKAGVTLGHADAALIRDALSKLAELEKQEPSINLPELIEGMTVSVDVSTCDADAGHRLFGIVNECAELETVRHGMILLVQNPEPNFKRPTPAADLSAMVPPGWKLVPVEPTPEMLEEIWLDERFKEVAMKRRYQALLAAAPEPE